MWRPHITATLVKNMQRRSMHENVMACMQTAVGNLTTWDVHNRVGDDLPHTNNSNEGYRGTCSQPSSHSTQTSGHSCRFYRRSSLSTRCTSPRCLPHGRPPAPSASSIPNLQNVSSALWTTYALVYLRGIAHYLTPFANNMRNSPIPP